jgi:monofunctional biosynthetic peptidoglycan transglycosylase
VMRDWFFAIAAESKAFFRWLWWGRGPRTPWVRRVSAIVFAFALPVPVLLILFFRFVPIPLTPQMIFSFVSGKGAHHEWAGYGEISPYLGRAVIASEDQRFCSHNGFDWQSIDKAIQTHERHPHRRLRGASTISQQAARTIFLVPARSWVRKGTEAYLTVLIEALWPKRRILTAYLNLVDWGHGNFGAEAAAENYFHKSAASLSAYEAARLAAILPNPEEWHAVAAGPYVSSRTATLVGRMAVVSRDGLDACVK